MYLQRYLILIIYCMYIMQDLCTEKNPLITGMYTFVCMYCIHIIYIRLCSCNTGTSDLADMYACISACITTDSYVTHLAL